MNQKLKRLEDIELLNAITALELGLIDWFQYFEIIKNEKPMFKGNKNEKSSDETKKNQASI